MIRVVGVQFQTDGKMQYYNAAEMVFHAGEYVVAETAHGPDLGAVLLGTTEMEEESVSASLPRIIRAATQQDIQQAADNRVREKEAYQICQRKIAEHKLEMKLVSVECTFDNSKMMFYFTANGRVDFRALVKDLASTFKTRIELRQIGVRDEARMLGGLGACGRPICCGTFLNNFQPVSIKMAKEQNLSLNPTKISGVCGRLMCCLKYEQDQYEQTRKRMPRVGREVVTPDGSGIVTDLNIVKETISVRIPSGDTTEIRSYSLEQLSMTGAIPTAADLPGEASADSSGQADDPAAENDSRPITIENPEVKPKEEVNPSVRSRRNRREKNPSRPAQQNHKPEGETPKGKQKPVDKKSEPNGRHRNGNPREKENPETRFGQPVRRENTEREKKRPIEKQERKETKGAEVPAAQMESEPSGRTVKSGVKSKKWADALEKAIQAADHD